MYNIFHTIYFNLRTCMRLLFSPFKFIIFNRWMIQCPAKRSIRKKAEEKELFCYLVLSWIRACVRVVHTCMYVCVKKCFISFVITLKFEARFYSHSLSLSHTLPQSCKNFTRMQTDVFPVNTYILHIRRRTWHFWADFKFVYTTIEWYNEMIRCWESI